MYLQRPGRPCPLAGRGLSTDDPLFFGPLFHPSSLSLSHHNLGSNPTPGQALCYSPKAQARAQAQDSWRQTGIGNRLSPCPERRRAPPYIHCFLFLLLFLYAPLQSLSPHLQLAVLRRLPYKFTCSIYRLTTGRLAFALGLGLSHPDWSPPNVVSPLPEGQEP